MLLYWDAMSLFLRTAKPFPWRIILAGVIIVFISLFAYKILYYYSQIKTGKVDYSALQFERSLATGSYLAKQAGIGSPSTLQDLKGDPKLGPDSALIRIVEFADFGCPFSQTESHVLRALAKLFPKDIQIIYKDFPLPDLHPGADLASLAAGCANDQDKFWEYHDALYGQSIIFDQPSLIVLATEQGLNEKEFTGCLESEKNRTDLENEIATGQALGVVGTPTFFINQQKIEGAIPFSIFKTLIEELINIVKI